MVSYLSWAANAVLFVMACYLTANTANTIFAAALAPQESGSVVEDVPPPSLAAVRNHRRTIVGRNLFQSSTVEVPVGKGVEAEQLEATKLPLDLLGTAAADDPALAWAAVLDREGRQTLVIGIGDRLKDKADVVRIERRRLVLLENGAHRELTFGDEPPERGAVQRAPRNASRRSPSVRNTARNRIPREKVDEALRDPSNILTQARFLPKYDDGEMIGFQVSAIKSDSLLKELGLQNGDLIKEFNGTPISSPQESARMLQEIGQAVDFSVLVEHADGSEDTFTTE